VVHETLKFQERFTRGIKKKTGFPIKKVGPYKNGGYHLVKLKGAAQAMSGIRACAERRMLGKSSTCSGTCGENYIGKEKKQPSVTLSLKRGFTVQKTSGGWFEGGDVPKVMGDCLVHRQGYTKFQGDTRGGGRGVRGGLYCKKPSRSEKHTEAFGWAGV